MLERRTTRGEGAFSRQKLRLLAGALTVGLLLGILPIAAPPALAARGATASGTVRSKVVFRWKTTLKKKVIGSGKYTVFVALKDRAGLRGKSNASFMVTR